MDELVLQSEQLAMEIDRDIEMPRIKRNLSQLLEAGNQLWNRTVGSSANRDASEVRASVLLGARGYDYQKVSRNLDSLVSRAVKHYGTLTNQPTQPAIRETDIHGFLKNERENAIIQVIDEIKTVSKERIESQYWHAVKKDWDKEKLELLNSISGAGLEGNDLDITSDLTTQSNIIAARREESSYNSLNQSRLRSDMLISSPPFVERSIHNVVDPKGPKSNMDYTEIVYAKCIMNYVDQVVSSSAGSELVKEFITSILREVTETNIGDLWDTVLSILSCCDPIRLGTDPIKLRQGLNFQLRFVVSSRQLLERKYREYAEVTVHGSLNKVDMSDPKAGYTLIKNFLGLKSPSWLSNITVLNNTIADLGGNTDDGLIECHPVWNFIWHCLRAGLIDAAIEVAQKSRDPFISEEFVEILRVYNENDDKRLPSKFENQLRLNYKRIISKSNDVYKKAVFNVLASCDLTFVEASERIEDYLWLRLCQVRFDHSNNDYEELTPIQQSTPVKTAAPHALIASNKLTLPQLQSLITDELGESHFNAQENPLSFFKVLFLTGQFEQAIEFLFRFQRFKSHAVHVAIALNEVGLLVKPDLYLSLPILSKAASANSISGVIKSLNFTNILIRYTKKFAHQNTTEALYYYYLLRNCTTPTKKNLFVSNVSELVRETRDFDNLLGYVNDFGRIRGVIDRFHLDVDDIVSKVAEDCENNGQYEDAVRLYDSTSKYGKVLEILTKLLSEVLPGRKPDKSERDKLENLAMKIAERYCEPEINAPREIAGTFYLLLDLMTFFNYYHSNQYNEALDTIQKLKILPFHQSEVEAKSREFNKYPEEIRRNISDILLATMNMLHSTYREQPSMEIRQKAKALITFSGMIQYRMPCDAIARLIELEVLIN